MDFFLLFCASCSGKMHLTVLVVDNNFDCYIVMNNKRKKQFIKEAVNDE